MAEEQELTVGEHLDELRVRLIRSLVVLCSLAVLAFIFKDYTTEIVFAPLKSDFFTNQLITQISGGHTVGIVEDGTQPRIINTQMAGQFNLHIKSSFFAALILCVPYLLWQLWLFIRPALSDEQQRRCRNMVGRTSLMFILGLLFGYFFIAPLAINFLINYQVNVAIDNMIEVGSYLSTVLNVSMASAIAFQLPLLISLLATMGIITSSMLRKYRRVSIFGIFVLSAVITPPDVISQLLISIPLIFLYEWGIIIAARIERNRKQSL